MTIYVWIEVGCLECGNPTIYRGAFATLDEAREQAPDATVLELGAVTEDDSSRGPWHGQCVDVIAVVEVP